MNPYKNLPSIFRSDLYMSIIELYNEAQKICDEYCYKGHFGCPLKDASEFWCVLNLDPMSKKADLLLLAEALEHIKDKIEIQTGRDTHDL